MLKWYGVQGGREQGLQKVQRGRKHAHDGIQNEGRTGFQPHTHTIKKKESEKKTKKVKEMQNYGNKKQKTKNEGSKEGAEL